MKTEPLTPSFIEDLRAFHDPDKGCSWSCADKNSDGTCRTAQWLATLDKLSGPRRTWEKGYQDGMREASRLIAKQLKEQGYA